MAQTEISSFGHFCFHLDLRRSSIIQGVDGVLIVKEPTD